QPARRRDRGVLEAGRQVARAVAEGAGAPRGHGVGTDQRQHHRRCAALDRLMPPTRQDRAPGQLRPVRFTRGYTRHAEGSVLVEFGATRVLCTATIEQGVPAFLRNSGQGWVTAEYGMLPRATHTRSPREAA